jgi:hypothetical protein
LVWQVPDPSQVSALSQTVSLDEPHEVPEVAKPFAGHEPATHVSATSHWPALPRQSVPFASLFDWQVPEPSHVSALSQIVSLADPHEAPALSRLPTHEPALHVSGLSQSVSELEPHEVPSGE